MCLLCYRAESINSVLYLVFYDMGELTSVVCSPSGLSAPLDHLQNKMFTLGIAFSQANSVFKNVSVKKIHFMSTFCKVSMTKLCLNLWGNE